ncbi:hypothetical protein EDD29_5869 [Actinocorallia herbida]|uniref:Uncharacterized protein n=1 Tax=Actinocorallia herbida TaxID=58109 RepID=A0A3N1D3V5_9ACTN|nr:DUF5701 family protein [Actinocorallia herbida]ROO88207.1 hypothetical protein EDD29_5869 [Actinocorallia herbida]
MTAPVPFDAEAEFDRQMAVLVEHGYPEGAGLDPEGFTALLEPLRGSVRTATAPDPEGGTVPFVLVVTREVVPIEWAMPRTSLPRKRGPGKPGFVDRSFEPGSIERFVPIDGVELPDARAYLLLDVERGEEFCNAVPEDAMAVIVDRGRTLLTLEEGIALITQFPGVLVKNKCFSLGASRCGDRRVPALWISGNAPKLGWCWAGNPHTWLGMASASGRAAR